MKHRGRLPEILRRAETGPLIEEKSFEAQLIRSTVQRLINTLTVKSLHKKQEDQV